MKSRVLNRRARPKDRQNPTFSRLSVWGLSVSVLKVGRAKARHGAMCGRPHIEAAA
jgi:hypothetical protein